MDTSPEIGALAKALAAAQRTMKGATKDAINPHFKSRYADLASCWDACREALTTHGLSVIQGASAEDARVTVTTLLLHESGQWARDSLTCAARDAGAQSVGSAITYGRRYSLCAMVGIAPEDDDGEAATERHPETVPPSKATFAAEINESIAAGYAKATPSRSTFKAPVRKAAGDEPPPITDSEIPF